MPASCQAKQNVPEGGRCRCDLCDCDSDDATFTRCDMRLFASNMRKLAKVAFGFHWADMGHFILVVIALYFAVLRCPAAFLARWCAPTPLAGHHGAAHPLPLAGAPYTSACACPSRSRTPRSPPLFTTATPRSPPRGTGRPIPTGAPSSPPPVRARLGPHSGRATAAGTTARGATTRTAPFRLASTSPVSSSLCGRAQCSTASFASSSRGCAGATPPS